MNNSSLVEFNNSYVLCERIFYPHRKGQPLFNLQEITAFINEACETLKEQKNCAQTISVLLEAVLDERYMTTSLFNVSAELPLPTNQPEELFLTIKQCLTKLYCTHEQYTRCEIVFLDLIPEESVHLFQNPPQPKLYKRMQQKEKVNAFTGLSKNRLYSQSIHSWKGKSELQSPKPINWCDLEIVLAK